MSRIELFITHPCLSYQPAMDLWEALREALPDQEYEVVNSRENRERAKAAGVIIDPAFVVDGRLALSGLPHRDRLIEKVKAFIKVEGSGRERGKMERS